MEILCVIPARGGSKGIPRKNIRLLCGKPLIAYSIEQAKKIRSINRIIVTTDDRKIAAIARRYGAEVPFLRPAALAGDRVPDLPVFRHALEWLKKKEGYCPDLVVHLRPTSPLRTVGDIEAGIEKMRKLGPDSVISVAPVEEFPQKMWRIRNGRAVRFLPPRSLEGKRCDSLRQCLPPLYSHNGVVDVIKCRTVLKKGSMFGDRIVPLVVDREHALDIDTPFDLYLAALLMAERNKKEGA